MKTNLWVHGSLCVIISIMLIIVCLISSVEVAAYSDFQYYEKEYQKYGVLKQLDMSMEDVMDVTKHMMSYLKGNEEELSITKMIEGKKQDFFNEQDRFHMEEVRNLFLGGIWIRRIATAIIAVSLTLFLWMKGRWAEILPTTFQWVLGIFGAGVTALGIAVTIDFTKCFVIFHEMFFDNDKWMFDSRTDFMIRMLPEGFFLDMVVRIGSIFILLLSMLLLGSIIIKRLGRKISKTYE